GVGDGGRGDLATLADELDDGQPLLEGSPARRTVGAHPADPELPPDVVPKRHATPARRRRRTILTCSRTTTRRNAPRITDSQYWLIEMMCLPFSNVMRLKISCSSPTPMPVASTDPTPPVSSVPPTTTAAMADSSQPRPAP